MFVRLKDPVSALTHLIGAVLSVFGLVVLVYQAAMYGTVWHVVSFTVFGISLIMLYTASTLYHSLRVSPQLTLTLRRIDHMMIFMLIAGTYTPFCLLPLRGGLGWWLFGAVWGCALLGMSVKIFWMKAPRWLYTAFYVLMGWLIVLAIRPFAQEVAPATLVFLAAGGLLYTIGAVLYVVKWPNPWPGKFGFHEVWHLFVMAGSVAHYAAVSQLV